MNIWAYTVTQVSWVEDPYVFQFKGKGSRERQGPTISLRYAPPPSRGTSLEMFSKVGVSLGPGRQGRALEPQCLHPFSNTGPGCVAKSFRSQRQSSCGWWPRATYPGSQALTSTPEATYRKRLWVFYIQASGLRSMSQDTKVKTTESSPAAPSKARWEILVSCVKSVYFTKWAWFPSYSPNI